MPASTGWYPDATPRATCTRHFGKPPKRPREHAEGQVLTWIWEQHKAAVEANGGTLDNVPTFPIGWNVHGHKLWPQAKAKPQRAKVGPGPAPEGVSTKAHAHAFLLKEREAQVGEDGHAGGSQPDLFDEVFNEIAQVEAEAASQARHSSVAAQLSCSHCAIQVVQDVDLASEGQPPPGSAPADSVAPEAVPEQAPKRRSQKQGPGHEGEEAAPKRQRGRPRKDSQS